MLHHVKAHRVHAGLWHADEESIVNVLLDKACESLNQALATGDRYQARLLLRLLAALTTSNVVSMPSMLGTLTHITSSAIQVLQDALGTGTTNSLDSVLLLCTCTVIQHSQSPPTHSMLDYSKEVRQYTQLTPCRFQATWVHFHKHPSLQGPVQKLAGGCSLTQTIWSIRQ